MIFGAYCVVKVHNMLPWWYYDNWSIFCRLQHHMGLAARNPDFVAYEKQRHKPDCPSAQSDQRICFRYLKSKVTRSVILNYLSLLFYFLGWGAQHDKRSGYAPGLYGLNGWSVVIFTFSFCPKFFF